MVRHACVVVVLFGFAAVAMAQGSGAVLDVFRAQVELEKNLLTGDLARLAEVQGQLRGASDRLVRLGEDLLRAEREGEEIDSYTARSNDIRRAELEVLDAVTGAQQLRSTIGARRGLIEQLEAEIVRLQEAGATPSDELSGRWLVAIEPGGGKGNFDLRQDGTLVSGQYQLAGGFRGSLRGTFVGGNIRLERIDAEKGFVAVFTARLVTRGSEKRLEGVWQSTELAAGMPNNGSWIGRREGR